MPWVDLVDARPPGQEAAISGEAHAVGAVVSGRIYLRELPVPGSVAVPGYVPTNSTMPAPGQFHVRYEGELAGTVEFHPSADGAGVVASYSGRGSALYAHQVNRLAAQLETHTHAFGALEGVPSTFAPDPEAVRQTVADLLVGGPGVSLVYDPVGDMLTIAMQGGGGGDYLPLTGGHLTGDLTLAGSLRVGSTAPPNNDYTKVVVKNADPSWGAAQTVLTAEKADGFNFVQHTLAIDSGSTRDWLYSVGAEESNGTAASRSFYVLDQQSFTFPLRINAAGRVAVLGGANRGMDIGGSTLARDGSKLRVGGPAQVDGNLAVTGSLTAASLAPFQFAAGGDRVGLGVAPDAYHELTVAGRPLVHGQFDAAPPWMDMMLHPSTGNPGCGRLAVARNPNDFVAGSQPGDFIVQQVSAAHRLIIPPFNLAPNGVGINAVPSSETMSIRAESHYHIPLVVRPKSGAVGSQETYITAVYNEAGGLLNFITPDWTWTYQHGSMEHKWTYGTVSRGDAATGVFKAWRPSFPLLAPPGSLGALQNVVRLYDDAGAVIGVLPVYPPV